MEPWRTTLVTVVFEPEAGLLELQARSVAAHVDPGLVESIVVIDNGWRRMPPRSRRRLLAAYGPFAERVRIVRARDLVDVPDAGGWAVQQILKLWIARQIQTPTYLVLDAKNHFVAPLHRDHLVDGRDRPRVAAYSFRDHPHRPRLERVLRHFDLDPDEHLDRFTATVTPYLLDRAQVLHAMDLVSPDPSRFPAAFIDDGLTEFFLYGASVLVDGDRLEDRFALQDQIPSTIWPSQADAASVRALVRSVQEQRSPVLSVHREAFAVLPTASQEVLTRFWTSAGLFPDEASAEAALASMARQAGRARVHKLVGRAVNSARSARARVRLRTRGRRRS